MNKRFFVPLTVAALAASGAAPAAEHRSSREEVIGVGSGAVVGALAGGPIGAVAGAVAGSLIGDKLHRSEAGRVAALGELELAESRLARLRGELEHSQSTVARLVREAEDARALAVELRFDVLFRTNEAGLVGEAQSQLADLAAVLAAYPELNVRLDGHTDPRGSDADNERLAAERAATVRQRLLAAGIAAQRIETAAHGERLSRAAEGDLDAYALERRVNVSLAAEASAVALNREPLDH